MQLSLKDIEIAIESLNKIEEKLLQYAKSQKYITHCFDCEESLSSLGREEYQHTCRCYCSICRDDLMEGEKLS